MQGGGASGEGIGRVEEKEEWTKAEGGGQRWRLLLEPMVSIGLQRLKQPIAEHMECLFPYLRAVLPLLCDWKMG